MQSEEGRQDRRRHSAFTCMFTGSLTSCPPPPPTHLEGAVWGQSRPLLAPAATGLVFVLAALRQWRCFTGAAALCQVPLTLFRNSIKNRKVTAELEPENKHTSEAEQLGEVRAKPKERFHSGAQSKRRRMKHFLYREAAGGLFAYGKNWPY